MEEEIDLRRYVAALFRYWWLVIIPPVIAVIAVVAMTSNQTPTYEAQVYVAASKIEVRVQFGSEVQTLTEAELASAGVRALGDSAARLTAYKALVVNPEIAQAVISQLADRLEAVDRKLLNPAYLMQRVSSDGDDATGDLIVITVSMTDPQLAADVANAWGKAYEQYVNRLYSGVRPQDVEAAHQRTEEMRQTYLDVQAELEAYLAEDPIPHLDSQIAVLQAQIDSYQTVLEETQSLASSRELASRSELLDGYYRDLVLAERLLDDARGLEQQLARGETSPAGALGDALAMILTRSRAFASASSYVLVDTGSPDSSDGESYQVVAPLSLQLQVPLTAENVTVADVENLIWVLENREAETESKIADLAASLLDPPQYTLPDGADEDIRGRIEALIAQRQALQARQEAESAHYSDLLRQRDLARDTYVQLARNEAEVQVAAESGGTEVRVATLAVPPAGSVGSGRSRNIAVAGALGLMLGIFGAFAVEWWRGDNGKGKEIQGRGPAGQDEASG